MTASANRSDHFAAWIMRMCQEIEDDMNAAARDHVEASPFYRALESERQQPRLFDGEV